MGWREQGEGGGNGRVGGSKGEGGSDDVREGVREREWRKGGLEKGPCDEGTDEQSRDGARERGEGGIQRA